MPNQSKLSLACLRGMCDWCVYVCARVRPLGSCSWVYYLPSPPSAFELSLSQWDTMIRSLHLTGISDLLPRLSRANHGRCQAGLGLKALSGWNCLPFRFSWRPTAQVMSADSNCWRHMPGWWCARSGAACSKNILRRWV